MGSGFHFTVRGIPVQIMPTFLIVLALLGWGLAGTTLLVAWVVMGVAAVLAHELGHAVAYRRFGVEPQIVLHGFGGMTIGRSLPVTQELAVSLAGPAVGLVLGLPVLAAAFLVPDPAPMLQMLIVLGLFVTIGWSMLNLVPILPLDGGHALAAVLTIVVRRDATQAVRYLSVVLAGALAVWLLVTGTLFLGIAAGFLAALNLQAAARAPRTIGASRAPRRSTRRAARPSRAPETTGVDSSAGTLEEPAATGQEVAVGVEDQTTHGDAGPTPSPRRIAGSRRGLEDEFASAAKSVLQGEPELALIAVARMRNFDLREGWLSVADQLEAWAWLQRGDLHAAEPFIDQVPANTVARRCLELGRTLVERDGALTEVPHEVAHLAATGAVDQEADGGGAVALSVLAAEVARRGGAGAIGAELRSEGAGEGASGALNWLSERLRIAGLTDAAGMLEAT